MNLHSAKLAKKLQIVKKIPCIEAHDTLFRPLHDMQAFLSANKLIVFCKYISEMTFGFVVKCTVSHKLETKFARQCGHSLTEIVPFPKKTWNTQSSLKLPSRRALRAKWLCVPQALIRTTSVHIPLRCIHELQATGEYCRVLQVQVELHCVH